MNNIQVAPANSWLQLVLGLRNYIYYILYRPVEGELCCIKKCDEVVRNSENETSKSLPERAARGDGGAEIETTLCYNLNLLPGRYRLGVMKDDAPHLRILWCDLFASGRLVCKGFSFRSVAIQRSSKKLDTSRRLQSATL